MAHTAIFLKRVCHQTIYDNWYTSTCMKYCYSGCTDNLAHMAQKVSLMLFKDELTPQVPRGISPIDVTHMISLETSPM